MIEVWAEMSEGLAALAEYLQDQGFYVKSLLPWGHEDGHYLSIYQKKDTNIRVILSLPKGSMLVEILRLSCPINAEYYNLHDPDSFQAIAARARKLMEK